MTANAIGFYWTLPVPRAGFVQLPQNVDEAAKFSKTIRYQRDVTRRFAEEHRFQLVHEEAFLEIEPNRGSRTVLPTLEKIRAICEREKARLLYVDFADSHMWRAHHWLHAWLKRGPVKTLGISPDTILVDGKPFDPIAHFRAWREADAAWSDGKEERVGKALARADELRQGQKLSAARIAQILNEEGLPTGTGKPWTEDSLRKQLKAREMLLL